MKKLLLGLCLLMNISAVSQTTLHPGDIVFKAFDTDISITRDKISVILLKEISFGTEFQLVNGIFNGNSEVFNNSGNALSKIQNIKYIGSGNLPINSVICFEIPEVFSQGVSANVDNFAINGVPSNSFKTSNIG